MKLKTAIFSIAVVTAGVANAQSGAESVRTQLSGMGYTNIEVDRKGNTVSVEAYRDGQKRSISYDATSGEILSDRSYRSSSDDRVARDGATRTRSSDESNDNSSNGNSRSGDESSSGGSSDNSKSRSGDESSGSKSDSNDNEGRSGDENGGSRGNDDGGSRSGDESKN